jgi:hypothetical protein
MPSAETTTSAPGQISVWPKPIEEDRSRTRTAETKFIFEVNKRGRCFIVFLFAI